jgi:DNA repair protein RadC
MAEDVVYHTLIKEMPKEERPRERLTFYGEAALSNAELLAIALRTGSRTENAVGLAQRLLMTFQGVSGLARASVAELCQVSGIGPAKAAQVKAALELGRRLMLAAQEGRPQITSPSDAATLLTARMNTAMQEQLHVLLLDTKHRVQRIVLVYVGNVNTSLIRVSEVFREAIKDNSTAIIVGHNHPSGDPTPSTDDIRVTEAIAEAGRMLDIKVLDHVIIGRQGYVSLKEKGLGGL